MIILRTIWDLIVVAAFIVVSLCASAKAQTIVEFKVLPPGHQVVLKDVGRVQYYLLEEYLKLAEGDANIVKLTADVAGYQKIIESYEQELKKKDDIALTLTSDKDILAKRGIRLEGQWLTCESKLINCANESIVPWVIAGVGTAAGLIGLGIYFGNR